MTNIATIIVLPKEDDTQGWELADLYVARGEIVTNRAVPNLT